jgi:P-type Cu+ transporter
MTRTADPDAPAAAEIAMAVEGMDCASCVAHVQKAAEKVPGVQAAEVNLARGRAVVRFNPQQTDPQQIAQAITDSGYTAAAEQTGAPAANVEDERLLRQMRHARSWFRRAMVGLVLWAPLELMHWVLPHYHWMDWLMLAGASLAITYVGWGFYRGAWAGLRRGTTNMDTLIAMGASVAYLYSLVAFIGAQRALWDRPHLYFTESIGLLALISLGHWLEARARESAGSAIRQLLNLTPATALRFTSLSQIKDHSRESGAFAEVPVHQLHINDEILVRPGDRIPIDGVIVDGRSTIDEAMISGEPLPVLRTPGENVIGGTVNQEGALRVRVTKIGSETALAQIVRMVETAQSSKPPVQRLADRISAVFVPVVLGIALITGVSWYVYGQLADWDAAATWGMIARAVCSVLIIACPCALGLAVPAALMVGTGRGAKRGILVRDISGLQMAERIDTVVLDKTGTLTRGKPVVSRIVSLNGMGEQQILRRAAAAEQFSEHPLAKAIVSHARERGLRLPDPQSFTSEAGYGIIADIDDETILVGSEELLAKHRSTGVSPVPNPSQVHGQDARATQDATRTIVHVAAKRDGVVEHFGYITITDELKPDSAAAVKELHDMNLRTVLLSGDNRATAAAIAQQVGIDDIRAEVKPDQKAANVKALQAGNRRVAMVGDGINDAPALAQADLGIAIGSGSDIAKETGDIILVGGSLRGIATAIRLSRATMLKIRQNLFFAFFYNVLAIPLAAFGYLNPLIAAAAMALSDITVIGNALLLRRSRID